MAIVVGFNQVVSLIAPTTREFFAVWTSGKESKPVPALPSCGGAARPLARGSIKYQPGVAIKVVPTIPVGNHATYRLPLAPKVKLSSRSLPAAHTLSKALLL